MASNDETYTYRAGKKVALRERPDQFVVREVPDNLRGAGFAAAEVTAVAGRRGAVN